MFRPYIFTIFRYKNTDTEGKVLQQRHFPSVPFFLPEESQYVTKETCRGKKIRTFYVDCTANYWLAHRNIVAQTRYLPSTAVYFNGVVTSSAQAVHSPRLKHVRSFPLRCFQYRFHCLYCRKNNVFVINIYTHFKEKGPRLGFCATNRKVAGSIPDGVTGFFRWHKPSDGTMALGSTQPLTEMSTGSTSCG
jgi:hypothetical protein